MVCGPQWQPIFLELIYIYVNVLIMYLIVLYMVLYVAELNVGNLDNKYCLTLHLVITLYMYYCTNLYPYHPNK